MSILRESDINLEFCIFTAGRTGSHLLASFLNDHPKVGCYGEYQTLLEGREDDIIINPDEVGGEILGCILPYGMRERVNKFDKVIFSVRSGRGHAESVVRNLHSGQATNEKIANWVTKLAKRQNEMDDMINKTNSIKVTYKKLTDGGKNVSKMPPNISRRVQKFLGVEPKKLTTDLEKGEH